MAQPQDASPLPQQPQQQQGHHSPVPSILDSFITASPSSETSAPHRLTDNDLLGMTVPLDRGFDDDTAPSSSDETPLYNVEGEVPDEDNGIYSNAKVRPLIYGYLLKMGRNGKWQKRFFETDGESLSYFKNEKRTKQLATLDLLKVGAIAMDAEDPSGCTFFIEVADRPYSLQAENKQTCIDWVINLNRVREARMQVGGVKLVTPRFKQNAPDFRQGQKRKVEVAPRVVLDANRPRTRAVDDEQQWREITETQVQAAPPTIAYENLVSSLNLAKWNKPRNTYYRVKRKIIKWARSIKKMAVQCTNPHDQVVLDSHLHPPGHDFPKSDQTSLATKRTASHDQENTASGFVPVAEDGETRELS